jgi:hypothetical protein
MGICEKPQPTRLYVNYPLPNFRHEILVLFWEIKKWFKAALSVALQRIP